MLAAIVFAASIPFLALFSVCFASFVGATRNDSRPPTIWERLLMIGTATACAGVLIGALAHLLVTDAGKNGLHGDALRALNILDSDTWIAWNGGLGVLMLGAGATALAHAGPIPGWLSAAALGLGVLLFVPYAVFFALLLTPLWMLTTSTLMFRRIPSSLRKPVAATA